jgi:hypothetical protein
VNIGRLLGLGGDIIFHENKKKTYKEMEIEKFKIKEMKVETNENILTIQIPLRMFLYWIFRTIEVQNMMLGIRMGI